VPNSIASKSLEKAKFKMTERHNATVNKCQRIPKGQSQMDNPPTTLGTQDEEKQSKNTTQYVLNTTIRKKTQIK
jgi:hypothetical protein